MDVNFLHGKKIDTEASTPRLPEIDTSPTIVFPLTTEQLTLLPNLVSQEWALWNLLLIHGINGGHVKWWRSREHGLITGADIFLLSSLPKLSPCQAVSVRRAPGAAVACCCAQRPAASRMSVCNSRTTCLQGMTNLILWALAWKWTVYPWHPGTHIAKGNASSSTGILKWIFLGRNLLVSLIGFCSVFSLLVHFLKADLLFSGSTTSWIPPFLLFKGSQNHHVIPQHSHTGKMTRLILFLRYQLTNI